MRTLTVVALALLVGAGACPNTTSTPPTPPPEVGRLIAVTRAGSVDVEIDSSLAPLAVAATVKVQGARVAGAAQAGSAAADRDLFKQKAFNEEDMRFAISDSRALRIQRSGVLVSIPVDGTPTNVEVTDITAASEDGSEVILKGFNGAPEARQ
ncbi:MAG: hypothetical protein AB2A00_28445 [Myxococcota bacterium]